jgi:hypothetical protein
MKGMKQKRIRNAALAVLAATAAGCGLGDTATTGRLTVHLADAACSDIASATVWISEVYVIGGADSTGARFTISDQAQAYDLLDLQGGVTAALGSALIPTGSYTQLRLVVDSARITLGNGVLFANGSATMQLTVPSGSQSGIKVNFSGPVVVTSGETVLVVDFDVCRSFVFTGPPGIPAGVNFTPLLHAAVRDVAGSIAGTAGPAAAKVTLLAILGDDTVATAAADTVSGAYALRFLHPGTYTVSASATGYQSASVNNIVVAEGQQVTGVDFTLTP